MMADNIIDITQFTAPVVMPDELKAINGWLVWKLEQKPGEPKPRKVPYYTDGRKRTGEQGSAADRHALATFAQAVVACTKGGYSGIGFACMPDFGVTWVDFDAVVVDGKIDPTVAHLVAGTYAEYSPSGTGIHAVFRGKVPANRKDNRPDDGQFQVEFFTSKGFVTFTGKALEMCEVLGTDKVMQDITPEIEALFIERFGVIEAADAPRQVAPVDAREVEAMLATLDPDLGYEDWVRVMMGVHHALGGEGFAVFDAWSSKGSKYPGKVALKKKWKSIKGDANGVTIASVLQMARAAGYTEDCSDEFEVVSVVPATPARASVRLKKNRHGEILATVENVVKVIERDDVIGWKMGIDSLREEIMLDKGDGAGWKPFIDEHYTELRIKLEQGGFLPVGREMIRDCVRLVASANRFDSAINWLSSLRWDGVARVERMLTTHFNAPDTDYTRAVARYIMTALAGRVLDPGVKADIIPILQGDQGTLKSTTVKALVPHEELFVEISLDVRDDDLARKIRGTLICELGELNGLHSREANAIKAWASKTHESWIPKYQEFRANYPRRCLFIGTTNDDEILSDSTGNRRYAVVGLGKRRLDPEKVKADREQLWAEAAVMYLMSGIDWSVEKLAVEENKAFEFTDAWDDAVHEWLNAVDALTQERPIDGSFIKTSDILQKALNLPVGSHNRSHEMRVSKIMQRLGWEKHRLPAKQGKSRGYVKPCPF